MKTFIKIVLIIGCLILLMVLISTLTVKEIKKAPKLSNNTVLKLSIGGALAEYTPKDEFMMMLGDKQPKTIRGLVETFEKAKIDEHISGVYLQIEPLSIGWAKIQELRDAMIDFRSSGKWIVTYIELASEREYYLALASDEIYVTPIGLLWLDGLSFQSMHIKSLFEKIDIEPEVENIGKYKSYGEMFKNDKMTDAEYEQLDAILDDFWNDFVDAAVDARGIEREEFLRIIDTGEMSTGEEAAKHNLIDGAKFEDEVLVIVKEKNDETNKDELTTITYAKYGKISAKSLDLYTGEKIAIIYALGNIHTGEGETPNPFGGGTSIGSSTILKAVRQAVDDDKIRAIVIRIDSGGGSAIASDIMWREILLATEDKPVIVSMSDVAASGGYYMACSADKIVCQPGTITGSIGVVSMKFNAEKLYEKIGIKFETINRGKYADAYYPHRGMRPDERQLLKNSVYGFYKTFVQRVSVGRGKSWDEIHAVAQGRIWSGEDALANGLIDALGGLNTAIEIAKEMAEIPKDESVKLVIYPKPKNFIERMSKHLGVNSVENTIPIETRKILMYINSFSHYHKNETLAIMPYQLEVE